MATALCGLPVTGRNNQPAKTQREHRRKTKDSRRRQAALLFLNNISLDGRPRNQPRDEHADQNADDEPGLSDSAGGPAAEPLPPAESHGPVAQVTEPAGSCSISSIPGVFTPTRPSSVTSPGFAGANEVFLEGGCAAEVLAPDTFTSPAPGVHQPCARVRSTPAAVSPVQAGTNLETRQRLRNVSGSPGPKVPKKVHFIKSMRQYDTRGCSDTKLEAQRQRLPSVVAADLLPSLEGVELGSSGKVNVQSPAAEDQKRVRRAAPASVLSLFQTVSYAQFLYPTNALARMKSAGAAEAGAAQTPQSRFRASGQRNPASAHPTNAAAQEPCVEEVTEYDPNLLSDPQWPCGRHKRVLIFASYMTTVIEYVKPSDLKKDMNVTFKERFPHIKLTLSKIRSLKREMRAVSEEFGLQPVTTAMAFVYFEKLVLQGRLNKQNRKLVAAACVLLAAKISSDLRKPEVKQLIDKLEERFRINRRELIPLEFPVLVALEMGLYFPESKVMPHYRRLVQQGH
ncbi:CDK5 and ABL1 enzyme substrate 2-like isoform X3 [Takifugu flavidus]|uniref:CDK5 and ABL1 enzyme substrate 2-like isoform X3 n=1 Tax=Takifugu flavidus TaxID=433684 RepID=UPI00254404EF|nr:CDK5 and ABL1 enzyme substrate 2-like isoform X3 [Takifugu flavidus]